jgi:hypothetical protein
LSANGREQPLTGTITTSGASTCRLLLLLPLLPQLLLDALLAPAVAKIAIGGSAHCFDLSLIGGYQMPLGLRSLRGSKRGCKAVYA